MSASPKFLQPASEVLAAIPISRSKLYEMTANHELPHYKCGARVLWNLEEVLAAIRIPAEPRKR